MNAANPSARKSATRIPFSSLEILKRRRASVLCCVLLLAACKSETPPDTPTPPEVHVVAAQARSVPLVREWVGRVEAFRQVEVRPQIEGTLWKRFFTEGREARSGPPP